MPQKDESWTPPVEFYFQVQFHFGNERISASFMEVSGLEQEIITKESDLFANDGTKIKLLKEISHGNITLKRSLEPISEKITTWVKQCFSYTENGRISPCMLVIFLMDSQRHAIACWACNHTYPIKWSLSALDAQKSGLAIETLTLTYNRIERKK